MHTQDIEAARGLSPVIQTPRYFAATLDSYEAACAISGGTRWCIDDLNWFSDYRGYGTLLYIAERESGRRWLLHSWYCDFRNWRNRRTHPQRFAEVHPELMTVLTPWLMRHFRLALLFGVAPPGTHFDHGLNLNGVAVAPFPEGLSVRDDLDMRWTGLDVLPRGLRVGGTLLVSKPVPMLPDDAQVGRVWVDPSDVALPWPRAIGLRRVGR
jgi:hypothetical protein